MTKVKKHLPIIWANPIHRLQPHLHHVLFYLLSPPKMCSTSFYLTCYFYFQHSPGSNCFITTQNMPIPLPSSLTGVTMSSLNPSSDIHQSSSSASTPLQTSILQKPSQVAATRFSLLSFLHMFHHQKPSRFQICLAQLFFHLY